MLETLCDEREKRLEKCKTPLEESVVRERREVCLDVLDSHTENVDKENRLGIDKENSLDSSVEAALKKEPEEEMFCRICYSYESPTGSMEDLVSPCGCKGTIKYVHRYCLRIWRFKGKKVKDIKVCEQCFCEYIVDDEKSVGRPVVFLSTFAIVMSLLIATSIFISSSADTASFITNDIYSYLYGNMSMEPFEKPIIICNMDLIVAGKNIQNPSRTTKYMLHKIEDTDKTTHFANVRKGYLYSLKNIHLIDLKRGNVFTSLAVLGCGYTISFEDSPLLFGNFILSFWRVISFGRVMDWVLYSAVLGYIYARLFQRIYLYIDNYCMYVANVY